MQYTQATTAPTVSYVYYYDSTYGTTADGMVVKVTMCGDLSGALSVRCEFPGVEHDSYDWQPHLHYSYSRKESQIASLAPIS
jgi:hypothetical protein